MDPANIPRHIAIIMDGNGRWAKERSLPRIAGHKEGSESVRAVLKAAADFGVKYLTLYAFSTENWKRPKEEVAFLMELFMQTIENEIAELMENRVRLQFLGRLYQFSKELQASMRAAAERTKNNDRITLNIMVNYGGRAEIVDAVNAIINERPATSDQRPTTVNETAIEQHLYTCGIPDPDLLIRTASEMRVSNFLLWQIAYAEIYVTPIYWPDFRKEQLKEAIEAYQKRTRKFGKTEEQIKNAA
ncbi:MAG: isoprenyl transferase [Candidatus Margulisbacteria bacterium]|nr:isoprenyl transferase [Candidatus Margulisiibacteriota bacterium]